MLGLVEVGEPGRYRFTHALVRDAVYEGLAAPARARAHADVALALEDRYAGQLLAHVGELAEHYRLAGPAHARSAWVFARRAAHAAAEQSAHDEALRLYAEAAACRSSTRPSPGPSARRSWSAAPWPWSVSAGRSRPGPRWRGRPSRRSRATTSRRRPARC